MAKKQNKAQLVRDYLEKHPGTRPSDIAKALSSKGVNMSNVSATITTMRKTGKLPPSPITRGKPGPKMGAKSGGVSLPILIEAVNEFGGVSATKKLLDNAAPLLRVIDQCGGIDKTRSLLDQIATMKR